MILHNGKEYYPLDFGYLVKDDKVYYDRSLREKNYFYLDLRTSNTRTENISDNTEE